MVSSPSSHTAVAHLIESLGGLRPLASELGLSVSTVQGWKERGKIPPKREAAVRMLAEQRGVAGEVIAAAFTPSSSSSSSVSSVASRRGAGGVVVVDEGLGTGSLETGSSEVTETDSPSATSSSPSATSPSQPLSWPPSSSAPPPVSPPTPPPVSPPSPPAGRSSSRHLVRRAVTWLAALALLVAIVWTWLDVFREYPPGERLSSGDSVISADSVGEEDLADLTDLAGGDGELEGRVRPALRTLPSLSRSGDEVSGSLRAEDLAALSALSARLLLLEGQLEDLTLSARAFSRLEAGLDARLQEIEDLARRRPDEAAVRALAILQLRHAVDSGRPYREALDVVLRLSAGTADSGGSISSEGVSGLILALGARADTGILPRARLRAEFEELRARVEADWLRRQGWWGRILSRLPGDLRFGRLGGVGGEGLLGRLGRAALALEGDSFAEALVALEGLGGISGGMLAAWQEEVRVRLSAEASLVSFETALLDELSRGVGGLE